ncbi:MAG: AMP-binding protein, partial [Candidatus Binataceae bacterium]
ILVQLPNWREFVALAVAAEISGVVFSFCPIQWGPRETLRALELIRPALWFTTAKPPAAIDRSDLIARALRNADGGLSAILLRSGAQAGAFSIEDWLVTMREGNRHAEMAEASGQSPLEIAVTSGSTGDPKGVLHVHDTALATVESTVRRQQIGVSDVVHVAIPLGHTFGYFYGMRCAMQAGGAVVLQERWDPHRMVELVEAHQVTVSLGPSAFVLDLAECADRYRPTLERMRLFTHAGDSLPAPIARRVLQQLPFRISRAFGLTEFGHVASTDSDTPANCLVDSVGAPQPEMEFRIVDDAGARLPAGAEGRLLLRGPFAFAGYLTAGALNQEVFDPDGFYDTGDLGFLDRENCLHISGRVKNVIRRGAETVPTAELEDIISSLPQVMHAVVVGMPDARLGEVPVACVQVRKGESIAMSDLARLFESSGMTRRFWPSAIRIVESWPVGATGKIDRKALLEKILEKSSR